MGAAAAMTPIGVLTTPDGATLAYDTDGITILKTALGTVTPILRPQINNFRWTIAEDQGPLLLAMVAGVSLAANADVGALTTAAPGADQHGIPANFGKGRGNWLATDRDRVRAHVMLYEPDAGLLTNVGMAQVSSIAIVAGDLVVLVRNCSLSNVNLLKIDFEYIHSINID
jgi:hypothetical protein